MKAKLVDSMPSGDWIYEIKFDGYRALALRGGSETRLLSRNQKDLGSKFPEEFFPAKPTGIGSGCHRVQCGNLGLLKDLCVRRKGWR